jgi:cell division protein FtsW (lipid II flippase)
MFNLTTRDLVFFVIGYCLSGIVLAYKMQLLKQRNEQLTNAVSVAVLLIASAKNDRDIEEGEDKSDE